MVWGLLKAGFKLATHTHTHTQNNTFQCNSHYHILLKSFSRFRSSKTPTDVPIQCAPCMFTSGTKGPWLWIFCCGCDIKILFSWNCVIVFSASWTWESRYVLQVAVGRSNICPVNNEGTNKSHLTYLKREKMKNGICSAFHFPNKTGKISVHAASAL